MSSAGHPPSVESETPNEAEPAPGILTGHPWIGHPWIRLVDVDGDSAFPDAPDVQLDRAA